MKTFLVFKNTLGAHDGNLGESHVSYCVAGCVNISCLSNDS